MSKKPFTLPDVGGLIEESLPADILHSYEKIPVTICDDAAQACSRIAATIAEMIKAKQGTFKLCFSTGSTPALLYRELVRMYRRGELSFADVELFATDEFYPAPDVNKHLRTASIREQLVSLVNLKSENIHLPNGSVDKNLVSGYCREFDDLAKGLDLLVCGIGEQGQLALNEAGTSPKSHTRTVLLSYQSRKRQAKNLNTGFSDIPNSAVTMGISTLMTAKKIIVMAWGEDKAKAVQAVCEGKITSSTPASLFQRHENICFYTDKDSASELTRRTAPWLVGPCEWNQRYVRKAVIWLCEKVGKPILKLTQKDYLENSLGELLDQKGPFDKINIEVFNDLQHTITGWPGGKPNADDSTRPVPSAPFPKNVVIFSPHPDDDVISMGGTFIRLVQQGHNVHVAYETSGNVAVHDDVVYQHIDAARELGYGDRCEAVRQIIASKKPGEPEPRALLDIKAAIRRSEARGAVRSFGLDDDTNAHFLNLPFYETGGIKKGERSQKDIDIVKNLLQQVKPDQIYLAGDLADPHGTHRVCTEIVLEAFEQLKDEPWMKAAHCWLYRGAWMEWELDRVDMAVPLSPDELVKKRHAIYRHLSQKDIMPFPGDDPREFWQRAEERTQNTAIRYDKLGMAEYQAIEVFVKLF